VKLFRFSADGSIRRFVPRPVAVPSPRPPGQEWLNGPLVWAIGQEHQAMYLFPRDCPRVLLWPVETTSSEEREYWFGRSDARFIAYIEWGWLEPLVHARLYRYELPDRSFRSLDDAVMWISSDVVEPVAVELIDDLPMRLRAEQVELRVVADFGCLSGITGSSLHVSAIRMRNAWVGDAGPPL
jgi:hypothetical protein